MVRFVGSLFCGVRLAGSGHAVRGELLLVPAPGAADHAPDQEGLVVGVVDGDTM